MGQTQNIEQQIRLLSNLQLGFGIAALLFLALAIFLFFYLHIPQVFNEYRGKSAQKAMEEMAANSSDSGRIVSMDKKSKNKKKGTGQLVQRRYYTDNLTDDLSGRISQEFRTKLKAQCDENGIELRVVDRWYPSSKICHCCGAIKKDLKLSDRIYRCNCGYVEDRDFNAALNLRDALTYEVA